MFLEELLLRTHNLEYIWTRHAYVRDFHIFFVLLSRLNINYCSVQVVPTIFFSLHIFPVITTIVLRYGFITGHVVVVAVFASSPAAHTCFRVYQAYCRV